MAQLTGIASGSAETRNAFLESSRPVLEPFEGLSPGRAVFSSVSLAWAAPSGAPLNLSEDAGASSFLLGRRNDTYWASVRENADGFVTVETDVLGVFPVYYYSTPDLFVFSTTPAVFKSCPGFRRELDIEGLTGLLLVNFIVDGRTILKGVRRLRPGHILRWKKGASAAEVKSGSIFPSDRYFGDSFEKNLDRIDGLLTSIIGRERAVKEPAVLLSGGLDSRVLAGYLHKIHGRNVRAVTQGDPQDFEMQCAANVARALGWPQDRCRTESGTFEACAMLKIEHEHLTHGFNTPYFTQLVEPVRRRSTRIYNGVHGDAALGCGTVTRLAGAKGGTYPFEAFFEHFNHSGFSVETVKRLIPPDRLGAAVENTVEKLRTLYESLPGRPFQRAWLFELFTADRLQVGFIPRMLAFGAWPVMPFVDRELLNAVAGMPFEALAGRRMEAELVCRKFPGLAVLPLDRNRYDVSPLFGLKRILSNSNLSVPQMLTCVAGHAYGKYHKWKGSSVRGRRGPDRRFYYQTFDVNSGAWKAFREKAESSRRTLEGFLDPVTLRELWPAPSSAVNVKNGITDTQGLKVLLGLAVWAEHHL